MNMPASSPWPVALSRAWGRNHLDSRPHLFLFCSLKINGTEPMTEARTYTGQCHCGAVRYTARTDLANPGDCNCSRCRRLGWVMQSLPATDFTLESGEDQLTRYHFNTGTIDHLFCRNCGIESFSRGSDGK